MRVIVPATEEMISVVVGLVYVPWPLRDVLVAAERDVMRLGGDVGGECEPHPLGVIGDDLARCDNIIIVACPPDTHAHVAFYICPAQ